MTHVGCQSGYDNLVDAKVAERLVEPRRGEWPARALHEHRLAVTGGDGLVNLPAGVANRGPDPPSQDEEAQVIQITEPPRQIPAIAGLGPGRGVKDRHTASAEAVLQTPDIGHHGVLCAVREIALAIELHVHATPSSRARLVRT